ncbi:Cof-type HAD-IIB family hydrolase [Terribacillus saccharophilus]|uniref:Cof-type HAD-IIB family hydrolase n=1 Tax=Terribacillus saccharophilus TaxID=361277 RepID=UPI002989EBDE|nr:Cof-type HAD-IIB family hydrolase [Terribacillus saccharophilus]MCM3226826.1 Cof-type HAD-IIB family hydrolase [Terribacillus saccharophilus]
MEKHLIALDLDGTLLTDDKHISEKNKQAIAAAIHAGHVVVIATGRPHRASLAYYRELRLTTPMVNFNGALIHHPDDKKWDAVHSPMPVRTARKIVDTCNKLDVKNIIAEVMDDVYIDRFDQYLLDLFHLEEEDDPIKVGSLKQALQDDPTSLLIYPHENQVASIRESLEKEHAEIIEHRRWGAPYHIIEIIRKGLSKAVGLQKISHYYDIPQKNIIAFGDEDNDLEMIEYAGAGVAMGNAIGPLKEIANYTTGSNMEDGIASFLHSYLKLEVPAN